MRVNESESSPQASYLDVSALQWPQDCRTLPCWCAQDRCPAAALGGSRMAGRHGPAASDVHLILVFNLPSIAMEKTWNCIFSWKDHLVIQNEDYGPTVLLLQIPPSATVQHRQRAVAASPCHLHSTRGRVLLHTGRIWARKSGCLASTVAPSLPPFPHL